MSDPSRREALIAKLVHADEAITGAVLAAMPVPEAKAVVALKCAAQNLIAALTLPHAPHLAEIAKRANADIETIVNGQPFADVGSTATERIILRALEASHGLPLSPPTRGGFPHAPHEDKDEKKKR